MSDQDILISFTSELNRIKASTFAPYKKANTVYQNLINAICVHKRLYRKDTQGGAKCEIETMWSKLKEDNFPPNEVRVIIKGAYENVKKVKSGEQSLT